MDNKNAITMKGNEISISVSVFLFRQGNAFIAYCPSLGLSEYDETEDGAKADFEYMLREWLKEQTENGTPNADLARHGWVTDDITSKELNIH